MSERPDVEGLLALAEAATLSPRWRWVRHDFTVRAEASTGDSLTVAETNSEEDAAYIAAADPSTVAALCRRVQELEAALGPLLGARHEHAHNGDVYLGGSFEDCGLCAPVRNLLPR